MRATMTLIGSNERVAYTIEHKGKCILVTGDVPITAIGTIIKLAPRNSVMDPDLARQYGATIAFGPEKELLALRVAAAPAAERRHKAEHPSLSDAACRWLAGGERGVSSNAIFTHITGVNASGSWGRDTPYDPADFRRCRLLLEQVPELAPELHQMRSVSPAWLCLVDEWPTICATMDAETPDWRNPKPGTKSPKTYALIKQAIGR